MGGLIVWKERGGKLIVRRCCKRGVVDCKGVDCKKVVIIVQFISYRIIDNSNIEAYWNMFTVGIISSKIKKLFPDFLIEHILLMTRTGIEATLVHKVKHKQVYLEYKKYPRTRLYPAFIKNQENFFHKCFISDHIMMPFLCDMVWN